MLGLGLRLGSLILPASQVIDCTGTWQLHSTASKSTLHAKTSSKKGKLRKMALDEELTVIVSGLIENDTRVENQLSMCNQLLFQPTMKACTKKQRL